MSFGDSAFVVKAGLAKMLKGGVIMDVINVEQAKIAEEAGAVAVMALERIPADIRYDGGVARMSDPDMIRKIKDAVTIPVMAKVRTLPNNFCYLSCNKSQAERYQSDHRPELGTLWRHRSWKPLRLTTSMRARF